MGSYLRFLKDYARDYVLENTGLKVLAFLITAVLWLSVAARPEAQVTLHDVPVEFYNLPTSVDLAVAKSDTLSARVYLSGPRDALDSIHSNDLTAVADLTGVEPGVRVIQLRLNRIPPGVELRGIEPRSVRVTVERVVEKEVPVQPRFDGTPPAGFEMTAWKIVPEKVRIQGAESFVREITQASTETVGLAEHTGPFTQAVAIDIGSQNVNVVDDRNVVLSVNISEINQERTFERVPVEVSDGPPSASAAPSFVKVTVYGALTAVSAMSPADIRVTVQYQSGWRRPIAVEPEVSISPTYSNRVSVRSVQPATVRVR
jgi:YbbR domain-containing protein